ncbi:MAG TPA: ornithine cyclodeaminase family protein [Candidatus Dormibacteraeota bacterium]|jgi:alanine dehydrogenase|nr:ornithine cyclodeaminase family protein [Candidatus Dormibacteraeota bacterium]
MTLHISEADVRAVFTMPMAIDAVEEVSRKQAAGDVVVHPRKRFEFPGGRFFHHMAAADYSANRVATKQYTYVNGRLTFVVSLYSMETGELLALMEGDFLGQKRTGAASGVATKYLARANAKTAAIIGTGGQARTQLEAIAAVRKLESVAVYGRDAARREEFAREMFEKLGIPVRAAASPAEAVRDVGIVCTATTSGQPVLFGADLTAGVHVNAIGANHIRKRELDDAAVLKADLVAVDSIEQSRQEAGDLVLGFASDSARWGQVIELSQIVAGKATGRKSDSQITLFKSNGIAAWDLAAAIRVYTEVTKRKIGRPLLLWQPAS